MQKGTVCGADRSVYKLNFFPWICFVFLFWLSFQCFIFVKGLAGTFVWNVYMSYHISVFPHSQMYWNVMSTFYNQGSFVHTSWLKSWVIVICQYCALASALSHNAPHLQIGHWALSHVNLSWGSNLDILFYWELGKVRNDNQEVQYTFPHVWLLLLQSWHIYS